MADQVTETLGEAQFLRLAQSLSLAYGLEVLLVLKDMWGLSFENAQAVAQWTASALVKAAISEAETGKHQEKTRRRRNFSE